jgi:hypothetical protein
MRDKRGDEYDVDNKDNIEESPGVDDIDNNESDNKIDSDSDSNDSDNENTDDNEDDNMHKSIFSKIEKVQSSHYKWGFSTTPLQCIYCKELIMGTIIKLKAHVSHVHPCKNAIKLFRCNLCVKPKHFSQLRNLQTHRMNTHDKYKLVVDRVSSLKYYLNHFEYIEN